MTAAGQIGCIGSMENMAGGGCPAITDAVPIGLVCVSMVPPIRIGSGRCFWMRRRHRPERTPAWVWCGGYGCGRRWGVRVRRRRLWLRQSRSEMGRAQAGRYRRRGDGGCPAQCHRAMRAGCRRGWAGRALHPSTSKVSAGLSSSATGCSPALDIVARPVRPAGESSRRSTRRRGVPSPASTGRAPANTALWSPTMAGGSGFTSSTGGAGFPTWRRRRGSIWRHRAGRWSACRWFRTGWISSRQRARA